MSTPETLQKRRYLTAIITGSALCYINATLLLMIAVVPAVTPLTKLPIPPDLLLFRVIGGYYLPPLIVATAAMAVAARRAARTGTLRTHRAGQVFALAIGILSVAMTIHAALLRSEYPTQLPASLAQLMVILSTIQAIVVAIVVTTILLYCLKPPR